MSPTRSSQRWARPRASCLGTPPGAQAEGDVLEGGQVREEEVVLEHDRDGAALGADEDVPCRIVEHVTVEPDAPGVDRQESGEASEQRGLAGAIGSENGDGLAVRTRQLDVEAERAERADDLRGERHAAGGRPPRKRSRRATRTPNDTAMSTRLRTIASSASTSFVR